MQDIRTLTQIWSHRVVTLWARYAGTEMPPEVRAEVATLESCCLQVRAALALEKTVGVDPEWQEAWGRELDRRVRELDSGAVKPIPWEQVQSELVARLASK